MHNLVHLLAMNGGVLAVLMTVGAAILIACCVGCTNCPRRSKDDLFRHREQ
jgi:hypothetical protein